MSGKIIEITDANFNECISSDLPLVIEFWTDWSGPSKSMAPAIEEIADSFEGKVIVGKVQADKNPNIVSSFGIRGIPTFIFFKQGNVVFKHTGALTKSVLSMNIEKFLV